MPDVRDVARLAGVSPSTVSNVVRGRAVVAADTKEKVEKAIEQLGYVPNSIARSFRQRSNKALGFVVPDAANPFYAEVFKGILVEAQANGLSAMVFDTDYSINREEEAIRILCGMQVLGIILVTASSDKERITAMCAQKCPVILTDTADPAWGIPCVVSANIDGAYDGVKHLIDRGHKRIAFVGEPVELPVCRHRYQGYLNALNDANLKVDDGLVVFDEGLKKHKLEAGLEIGRRLFGGGQLMAERPTAIFAAGDLIAIGLMRAAAEVGVRIPQDFAIVGFDDIEMAAYSWPSLTTVRQDRFELGRRSVKRTLDSSKDNSADVIPTKLIIRSSS